MIALAYRIIRLDNKEVIMSGIVRNSEDNIYPAQEIGYMLDEFPELPYEVELHHFKVKGLKLETHPFVIEWKDVIKLPNPQYYI